MAINKKLLAVSIATTFSTLLMPGNARAIQLFSGTGANAGQALEDMKAALGGVQNVGGPTQGGFRQINWDGVGLNGTDINPNTKVIAQDTVNIPVDRFLSLGTLYEEEYTVSGDGFATVNPDTAGEFPAFSPKNTFAMFDDEPGEFEDRFIEQSFTLPGTTKKAATRGFGVMFQDVELAGSTSIELFNGSKSLGKFDVDPSASQEQQFLGILLDDPLITDVQITVGSKALFNFDGQTITSFGAEDLPNGIDLATTDNFIYAEPESVPEPATGWGALLVGLGVTTLFKKKKSLA